MKKNYLLCLFLLAQFTFAQGISIATTDSIEAFLKGKNSKDRCLFLLEKADHFSTTDIHLAHIYGKKSVEEALKSKDNSALALSYNTLGNIHQYKTDTDSALFFHKKSLHYRTLNNDTLGIADSYNNLGIAFDTKGDFENALKHYFQALRLYEKKQDDEKTAMTLINIGVVYKAQKEYRKAYFYYKKAYEIYTKIKSDFGTTVTAGNLGSILINFQNYKQSLLYSEQAKEGYEKLGYKRYLGYPISNIAIVYDSLHRFKEANENYLKSITLHQEFANNFEVANICSAYSTCLLKQNKFEDAIMYGKKALKFATIANADFIEINAIDNLAKAYAKLGIYDKAYYYASLHKEGTDKLFRKEKTKAIFELEAKYEIEKKSKQLLQIENKMQQRNTLLLVLSLIIISVGLISYLLYRQQKIRAKQTAQEYELKSAIAAIESQNKLQEQRLAISRDLHDNIGAQLTFIISSINNITHAFDIKNLKLEDKLQNISSFTKATIVELRDTIWAMNSKQVSLEDLKLRIYNFIEKAKLAVEETSFSFTIDPELSSVIFSSVDGMNIYRVVQEAVHNSIKYAQATAITVDFKKQEHSIIIEITDNGVGFEMDDVSLGNGIYNMKKRIKEIQGTFSLNSTLNQGTAIIIELPYK